MMLDAITDVTNGDAARDAAVEGTSIAEAGRDATSADSADPRTSAEGGAGDAAADAASVGSFTDATATTVALLRVANWSPDSPAIDACIAPRGTTVFQGPIAATLAAASLGDAGAAAVSFPLVTAYIPVAPGQYDVRFVAAGAGSCAVGIARDATALAALAAGDAATVALLGELSPTGGDPGLRVVGFLDDTSSNGGVALRVINAAPSLSLVDVGTGNVAKFKPFFLGLPFGQASGKPQALGPDATAPTVNANGYLKMQPLSGVTLSAHPPNATTDTVVTTGLSAASGSVLTVALVGGTSAGVAARLLECVDNAGTVGPLSNCTVLP